MQQVHWHTNLRTSLLVKRCVIRNPATLFTIQPECIHADAFFQVKHPAGADVNYRCTHSCNQNIAESLGTI